MRTKASEAKVKNAALTAATDEDDMDNFDKFGEKEGLLRQSKPNKFRLDILNIKGSNKKSIRKKIKKLKKESNDIYDMRDVTFVDATVKKKYVDLSEQYAVSKENRSVHNSDDSDAESVWSVNSGMSIRSERSCRRGRDRHKRFRIKRTRSTSCLSRTVSIDSDSEYSDDEDPLLKIQKRAGSSARPSATGDIRELIGKIRGASAMSLKTPDTGSTSDLRKSTSGNSNTRAAQHSADSSTSDYQHPTESTKL